MVKGYHVPIKDLPVDMRPRERLEAKGAEALADSELLAILLGSGTRSLSAIVLAEKLMVENDGLRFASVMSFEEMKAIKGIGAAKAARIKAAVELGRRLSAAGLIQRYRISSPQDVSSLVMEQMRYLDREYFKCAYLNRKNQVLAVETISVGSLASSPVHPREVFKPAIRRSAASIVLIHNHPSGDPNPSQEDVEITKRLVAAGGLLGIDVLDHIIIGDGRYVSMKSCNIL